MKRQRVVLGFFKEKGKTKPITKSAAELNRKKIVKNPRRMNAVKPNGSRWTLTYKRTRQLKQLSIHFLEKHKPKCYFCHQLLTEKDLPDNITDHHINGDHNDNRPANKALAHETCHRQHHYTEVSPRNHGKSVEQKIIDLEEEHEKVDLMLQRTIDARSYPGRDQRVLKLEARLKAISKQIDDLFYSLPKKEQKRVAREFFSAAATSVEHSLQKEPEVWASKHCLKRC